jgi:hypothetical protein
MDEIEGPSERGRGTVETSHAGLDEVKGGLARF